MSLDPERERTLTETHTTDVQYSGIDEETKVSKTEVNSIVSCTDDTSQNGNKSLKLQRKLSNETKEKTSLRKVSVKITGIFHFD